MRYDKKGEKLSSERKSAASSMRKLPSTFSPGPLDVICARGATVYCHLGNRRYRDIIKMNLKQYSEAKSKMEKSRIVSIVLATIRRASPEGGFIKEESGSWYEVGDSIAREKIGQSFRDSLHTKYRSSSKAKNSRSKARKAQAKNQKQNEVIKDLVTPEHISSVAIQQLPISWETTMASKQTENRGCVNDMSPEFINEDLDNFDYVSELFQAFPYYEDNLTDIQSFSYYGNDDTRILQPRAVEELFNSSILL